MQGTIRAPAEPLLVTVPQLHLGQPLPYALSIGAGNDVLPDRSGNQAAAAAPLAASTSSISVTARRNAVHRAPSDLRCAARRAKAACQAVAAHEHRQQAQHASAGRRCSLAAGYCCLRRGCRSASTHSLASSMAPHLPPEPVFQPALMESGRTVNVTLHKYPVPEQGAGPAGAGQVRVQVVLCNALLQDGSTRVRLLLFQQAVSQPAAARQSVILPSTCKCASMHC